MVIERKIAAQYSKQLAVLGKAVAMNHIRLHLMEERLHERIVRDLARTVHALGDLQLFEPLAERIDIVFNTPIRVEDQPRWRAAPGHRMIERTQGQCNIPLSP